MPLGRFPADSAPDPAKGLPSVRIWGQGKAEPHSSSEATRYGASALIQSAKAATMAFCRKVVGSASPETQVNFAFSLIEDALRGSQSRGEWPQALQLRRRLLRRFLRSWPYLASGDALRVFGFFHLLSALAEIPGDIVECGVGRGRTLAILCAANVFFKLNRNVYGFDSFEGFPDATESDRGARVAGPGAIHGWDDTAPEMILEALRTDSDGSGERSLYSGLQEEGFPERLPQVILP